MRPALLGACAALRVLRCCLQDFWVAALWKKLMDVRVLGANQTTAIAVTTTTAMPAAGADPEADKWVLARDQSCNFGEPYNGTPSVLFLGKVGSAAECQAKCASQPGPNKCKAFSWCGDCGKGGNDEWVDTCYGRLDEQWALHPVHGAVSGCDKTLAKCVPTLPPPPPPPAPTPLAVRTFAHCSKLKAGAVVFAVAVSPCVRTEAVDLRFPGATSLTTWWLDAKAAADDMVRLNGKNLTVSVDSPLPSLEGEAAQGSRATVPAGGVCAVGFVQAEYSAPVAACR